jgi:NAD(P)-dependent dehydrogenase (short-subunit alcohol dehydrogenase family)
VGELSGKVALVTGGTAGIGRASALALAAAGCRVMIVGRNAEAAAEVIAQAGDAEMAFYRADLAEAEAARTMVSETVARFGRIDIAFNNAGHRDAATPLVDLPLAELDRVMAVNFRSVLVAMQAQIATMLETGGGVIINNASVSGVRNAMPGIAAYAASKAALISLTRSAAVEYAPQGVRINALSPGRIRTGLVQHYSDAEVQAVAAGLPAGRLGDDTEAAAAVLWLASPASSFVVGHNLCVDGGFLAG